MKNFYLRTARSLAVTTGFLAFPYFSFSQSTCGIASSDPYTKTDKCRAVANGDFDYTFGDRVSALGSTAGHKKKPRSLFVNQKLNGEGNFAVIENSQSQKFADPDEVGSTFAIDEDGDCEYEREDELLHWIAQNHFNEIVLYNVSNLLTNGSENLISSQGSKNTFYNNMGEIKPIEWHLSRFIYKAKTEYDLDVVGVVASNITNIDYQDRFYKFHLDFTRNSYEYYLSLLEDYTTDFVDHYISQYTLEPWNIKYLDYGEDTLFLPVDDDGRISDIDKAVVDIYNAYVFQLRLENGYIHYGGVDGTEDDPDACNSLPTENSCLKGFNAHMFEWEWWDSDASQVDAQLDLLEGLVTFAKTLEQNVSTCNLGMYVCQDRFDRTNWPTNNYTAQQRADKIDAIADRVYLYSYHNNPCDCYNGLAASTNNEKFSTKVDLLANNNIGANNGQTVVVPVFNGKYRDLNKFNAPRPQVYGDGNDGCGGDDSNCDYCANYSGNALNSLASNGYNKFMGYIENVFQDQYDLDASTTSTSDNNIYGYCWFKSRLLIDNEFLSNVPVVDRNYSKNAVLFPNPSVNGHFELRSSKEIDKIRVYTLSGQLVVEKNIKSLNTQLELTAKGVYVMQVYYTQGEKDVFKLINN